MTDVSNQVFFDTIEAQGRRMLRFLQVSHSQASSSHYTPDGYIHIPVQPPDPDLLPPLALRDVSQVLREIMTVYDSSLLEGEALEVNIEKHTVSDSGFSRILDAAVEPALEMCRRMGDIKKDASTWEKGIFLVNCAVHLQVRDR